MALIDELPTKSIGEHLSPVKIEIWRAKRRTSDHRLDRSERDPSQNFMDQGDPTTCFALPELPVGTKGNICGSDHPALFPLPSPLVDPRVARVTLPGLCLF
jgi:hypothetical protein